MAAVFELKDFNCVHNLLLQVMEELVGGKIPLPAAIEDIRQGAAPPDAAAVVARWLWVLEDGIGPDLFRRTIERLNPPQPDLAALARYFSRKTPLLQQDMERLEWLLAFMFRRRNESAEPPSAAEMLPDIQTWLGKEASPLSLDTHGLLAELSEVREEIVACRNFRKLTHSGLVARGRRLKQSFKEELLRPEVLAVVVSYNLACKRRFEQLLGQALESSKGLPSDLQTKEYRAAAEDFRQWMGSPPAPAVAAPGRPLPKMEGLTVDPKTEEAAVQAILSKVIAVVRESGGSPSSIPLPNSTLYLSPWEVLPLLADYPETEKSFRADLARVMRRAVGLLAAIQEETALYKVRSAGEHLWRRHLNSLTYLLYRGSETLRELENLVQEAGLRGLRQKAELLEESGGRLRQQLQEVSALVEQAKERRT